MPSKHKRNPVTFRPPEGDRVWLYEHARATGEPVGAILVRALAAYRKSIQDRKAGPADTKPS
jgi:hypothetical protein